MHVYLGGSFAPASSEMDVAGMMPGSEQAARNISKFVNSYRKTPIPRMMFFESSQSSTGATATLNAVAGMLIMRNVLIKPVGWPPQKQRALFPHKRILFLPMNRFIGYVRSSSRKRCSSLFSAILI